MIMDNKELKQTKKNFHQATMSPVWGNPLSSRTLTEMIELINKPPARSFHQALGYRLLASFVDILYALLSNAKLADSMPTLPH